LPCLLRDVTKEGITKNKEIESIGAGGAAPIDPRIVTDLFQKKIKDIGLSITGVLRFPLEMSL
jgi:predicted TIM-barrel enzyme